VSLRKKLDGALLQEYQDQCGKDAAGVKAPREKKTSYKSCVIEEIDYRSEVSKNSSLDD
jgi:hypothetical protein